MSPLEASSFGCPEAPSWWVQNQELHLHPSHSEVQALTNAVHLGEQNILELEGASKKI